MIYVSFQLALAVLVHGPATLPPATCTASIRGRPVPAEFVGNRIFIRWNVAGHGSFLLYTDTGGGLLSLYPEAVQRLSLPVDTLHWTNGANHGTRLSVQVPPAFNRSLVPPIPSAASIRWYPVLEDSATAVLLVQYGEPQPEEEAGYEWDGRLGSEWFGDRVWILDYPNRRLYFSGTAPVGPMAPECWTPLGFQTDSSGRRTNHFPRITARIDGDDIQFLLDTGAQTTLTDGAWRAIGPREPRHRAASFITKERFDQWHNRHTDWLVIPDAEQGDGAPMIRVPTVEVGGHAIGPVWFTERPDASFRTFMSQYMDRPIEGALGGSAWRYVALILDYPRARAAVLQSAAR